MDVALILISLPLTLPVAFVVGAWIKIVSRGPLLFCQKRIGMDGKPFTLCKFRSMEADAETRSHEQHLEELMGSNRPMTKLDVFGDSRVIKGGGLIRSSGLDELPQLLNVLRGEMSLVGPRPCTEAEYKAYKANQMARFRVLPGLTGYWQVNGKNRTTFVQMVAMDAHYAENANPGLDARIILKTVPAMIEQVVTTRLQARAQRRDASASAVASAADPNS